MEEPSHGSDPTPTELLYNTLAEPDGYVLIKEPSQDTESSKKFIENNMGSIGKLNSIRLMENAIVQIVGEKGSIITPNFGWGYNGEGSHGLLWLLNKINSNDGKAIWDSLVKTNTYNLNINSNKTKQSF